MEPAILTNLLGHGVIGVIAALFIGLYLRELAEHKASKSAHVADVRTLLEKSAKDAAEISARHAFQLRELHTSHQEQLDTLHEQIHAMREAHADREKVTLQTIEYFARQQVEAVEDLAKLGDLLRRAYDRLRR